MFFFSRSRSFIHQHPSGDLSKVYSLLASSLHKGPDPANFINYSSTFKSLKAVKDVVSVEVWDYVEKSPLGPARFSLFEFEYITGLNSEPLPNTMVVEDIETSNSFWAMFNLRRTRSTPSAEDIRTLCRSPDVCRSWSREDQIRLCYLAILTGSLLALDRREAIPPAKEKLLMDLDIFEQYPWGRVDFVELVQQIKDATATKIKANEIGRPFRSNGPCLLRFKGNYGKLSLGSILEEAKVTCMSLRSVDEVYPVWEYQDEDPEIDNLLEFLRQDNSLSTITWQALPEYPLTPIECNKHGRVASQRKSKKPKKVASDGQENIADGGEKCGDIAKTEEQVQSDDDDGNFFIQRRKNPERLFHMEPPHVGTFGNLISRVATLERTGCEVKKFVDLVSRVLSLEEDWRVPNTRVKLSNKEAIKEGENMVKLKGKATDVGEPEIGEDYDKIKSPHVSMEEEVDRLHEEAVIALTLMSSETFVVGTRDNQLQSVDDAKALALKGDEDKPQSASSNIITSSKPIRRSARIAALSEKLNTNYLVVYGPVDKTKVKALNAFIKEKGDSTYPPGNVFTAKEFFHNFMKPRSWLSFVDLDVPVAMYRVRFSRNPSDFISPRIAILDAVFQTWWSSQYKAWLGDQSNIPKGVYDYYSCKRPKTIHPARNGDEMSIHYIHMTGLIPMKNITQAAIPFARMIPYDLYAFSDPEVKQVMDTAMYSIQFVGKPPYGDCGIYAVKFLECLVMGVAFADEHLCDDNMMIMRRKLAAEMYDETRHLEDASPASTGKPFLRNASPASFKDFFSIVNFIVLFISASYSSLFQGNTYFCNFYHKQALPVHASLPMEFSPSLFSDETRPDPANFINYSSTFKSLKVVKDVVSVEVWDYVEKSPLGIIIKFMDLEFAWSSTLVHNFFSRQLYCKKRHKLWFLIGKQPARFSLFEFEGITGLNCEPLPNTMVVEDVKKTNSFWALFNMRRNRSTPSVEDIRTLCRSPDRSYPPAKAKLLMDLDIFEQYPWGRVAFVELVQQIKDAIATKIKANSYVCKGSNGPCLLRFKGKYGKLSLGSILEEAKVTCMSPRSVDEVHPVWEHQDEDPEIDNLLELLRQDDSLSTITWQALPEYPLTPIECNKRGRVTSQRKSKKPKKVASDGKENIADGGEKRDDIAKTEEELPFERQGINVGRSAPQTEREDHPDNPEEENA
ncbi:hypothetical protein F2Q69_00012143 [Brassica cretica]|uniref:Ubiquitin-like protease family profile domain-containing protein n=1 Tax=Brassica cretica TaxID=69181 RepID=A0A8S9QVF5_BRACR|nr:hypothetical protein F2Q69_00012143 [Brassica cretica]